MAEQAFGRSIEGLNQPPLADDHGRVGDGVEDRAEMRFARHQVLRCFPIANSRAAELLAEPGDARPDHGEDDRLEDPGVGQLAGADEEHAEDDAEGGRQQPRAKPTETGGEQDGRDEDNEGGPVLKPWVQTPAQQSSSPTAPAAVQ